MFHAPLESSSVVGYANKADGGNSYNTIGGMFVTVGGSGSTFKLNDITMYCAGGNHKGYRKNTISFIDPVTSRVDNNQKFTYYAEADGGTIGEDVGWYYMDEDETWAGDNEFPIGTAFLCNFIPSLQAQLTFAGQVLTGDITIDTVVEGEALPYMYICNPIPAKITLNDIEMVSPGDNHKAYRKNTIAIIDPVTSRVDNEKKFTFYSEADGGTVGDDVGWYYMDEDETWAGDYQLDIGDGFLCNFVTKFQSKLIFKNPVK